MVLPVERLRRRSDPFPRVFSIHLSWFVPKKKPADLRALLLIYFGVRLRRNTDLTCERLIYVSINRRDFEQSSLQVADE
jgi:hypothetical protein